MRALLPSMRSWIRRFEPSCLTYRMEVVPLQYTDHVGCAHIPSKNIHTVPKISTLGSCRGSEFFPPGRTEKTLVQLHSQHWCKHPYQNLAVYCTTKLHWKEIIRGLSETTRVVRQQRHSYPKMVDASCVVITERGPRSHAKYASPCIQYWTTKIRLRSWTCPRTEIARRVQSM